MPREDAYVCATHRAHVQSDGDPSPCPTGWHKRAEVDGRFLKLFEREFLDYGATRDRVAAELDKDFVDVRAQVDTAELEVARIERKIAKVEADYFAEELGAASFERMSAALADELEAATAERDRLRANADRIAADRADLDAESEALRRVTALRNTIAAQARDRDAQDDLESLRGVVASAFSAVYLSPDGEISGLQAGARMVTGPLVIIEGMPKGLPTAFRVDGDLLKGEVPIVPVELPRYAIGLEASGSGARIEKVRNRTL
jgi:hypothetical protein